MNSSSRSAILIALLMTSCSSVPLAPSPEPGVGAKNLGVRQKPSREGGGFVLCAGDCLAPTPKTPIDAQLSQVAPTSPPASSNNAALSPVDSLSGPQSSPEKVVPAAARATPGNGFTIVFNPDAVRLDDASTILLREFEADIRHALAITVTGYAAQSGNAAARTERARARAVEVRQALLNLGVRPAQVRAFYRTDCCWVGASTDAANNRAYVEIDAGHVARPAHAAQFNGGEGLN